MPAILERLVSQLQGKGYSKSSAFAIATKSLQRAGDLKKGTQQATPKGARRGAMSPGARAKDRASKRSKHKSKDYGYSSKTNRATLKK
ncbi:MAG TPA: hypothetical protein VEP90_05640 [Methylomirabilota bacterium]|nr:hypothetical protein [Methylomirabilota bacterium]